jgi:EpsI family protein
VSLVNNKFSRVLTLVLLLQAAMLYGVASRAELVPSLRPLADFPRGLAGWNAVGEFPIEPEIQEVLRADDTLNRIYQRASDHAEANLFLAFFKTQREGQSPHSPKNCLPGNGWQPVETGVISIELPGRRNAITANRYVASHGGQKAVIIYWYQSHSRIIADEYAAKFWLIVDSIRYHRSDTALVRVVVPIEEGKADGATSVAVAFVKAVFPELAGLLPV